MLKLKQIYPLLIPAILLLASCQGNTDRTWQVENQSATTIHVEARLITTSDTLYEIIETGGTRIITITNEEKGNSLPQQAWDVFSHFRITNAGGDTLRKNFTQNENWDIYIEQTKSNPDHFEQTYTVVVKNEDF